MQVFLGDDSFLNLSCYLYLLVHRRRREYLRLVHSRYMTRPELVLRVTVSSHQEYEQNYHQN